jgi:hypothetical protein
MQFPDGVLRKTKTPNRMNDPNSVALEDLIDATQLDCLISHTYYMVSTTL